MTRPLYGAAKTAHENRLRREHVEYLVSRAVNVIRRRDVDAVPNVLAILVAASRVGGAR